MLIALLLTLSARAATPEDAVVLVEQGGSVCAGAFIDGDGHVATAYHCVASGGRPLVTTRAGQQAVGRVVGWEQRTDLALIEVRDLRGAPHLALRDTPVAKGEPVRAWGHPFGVREQVGFLAGTLRWSVSEGVVSNVGAVALQITAAVNPGNSGGPVVDGEERLVGVVSRRLSGEAMGFAGSAERIPHLLEHPRGLWAPGGTVSAGLWAGTWLGDGGTFSGGGQLEVSLRDRVFLSGALGLPYQARWDALRSGRQVSWVAGEARLGGRQRLFRGSEAITLDAWAGALSTGSLAISPELDFSTGQSLLPTAGAGFSVAGTAVEFAWALEEEQGAVLWVRTALAWPGHLWMW
ncbi:MAG: trypsin-like peptidase domain-containing protein [Deltaproteobacteria bacterium]|nr:trypsin-like peptidase domain-containing protein [Deltaproteobacteria bacterium]